MQDSNEPTPTFAATHSRVKRKGKLRTNGREIQELQIEALDVVTSGSLRISAKK